MSVDAGAIRAGAVVSPESPAAAAEALREAAAGGKSVLAVGGGRFVDLGGPRTVPDVLVRTTGLAHTVFHEPQELVVRVGAGMTLAALQDLLGKAGQEMPWDYPWPELQTVGGILAQGIPGPRRLGTGAPRDHVLGLEAVLPDGSTIRPGGRVVKNVAGYDLTRLLVGSAGLLGVITEATLRVRPVPEDCFSVSAEFGTPADAAGAVAAVLTGGIAPSFLELRGRWGSYTVAAGTEGLREAVAAGRESLLGAMCGGKSLRELRGAAVRGFLAEWTRFPWDGPGFIARVSVPRGALLRVLEAVEGPLSANAGNGVVRVAPGRNMAPAEARDLVLRLHAMAAGFGGWAVQERGPMAGPEAEPGTGARVHRLNEQLRLAVDPGRCLGCRNAKGARDA